MEHLGSQIPDTVPSRSHPAPASLFVEGQGIAKSICLGFRPAAAKDILALPSFFCVGHWLVQLGKTEAAGFYESFCMSKSFPPIPSLNSRQLTTQTPSEKYSV